MSDHTESSVTPNRGDSGIPTGVRRAVLLGAFAVLIVTTLAYGLRALDLLSSRDTRMSGPTSPVTAALDQLSSSLRALTLDDHPERHADPVSRGFEPERLKPLQEAFDDARSEWLRYSESDLAVDVLLSRHLNRKLAEVARWLERTVTPLQSDDGDRSQNYNAMQRAALEADGLVDRVLGAQLDAARVMHARDMREIRDATRIFVYLAGFALLGFAVLVVAYLRQVRRYDGHIGALDELARLLSTKSGVPLFEGMVDFLGRRLGYAYVFIAQVDPEDPRQVSTLAVHAHGKLAGNISYRLPGTPCENVLERKVCFYPSGVQQAFPEDRLLQEMGVDSYAGTPLLDANENPIGILVLLDATSIDPADIQSSLIQIVASRAQTEIERMRAETLRMSTLDGLEARVDARTADLRRTNAKLEEEVRARRAMERELEEARNVAERGDRAKGEFLANASHEIRTHINGLLGMLSLLEDGEMQGEQLEYVEMAHASGDVLLALINDLLDYSKIEAGQLQIESVDFDIDQLVREVGDLFGVRARSAGLALETEVDVGLPRQLRGDVVRIRQVLSNLVDNALKFTNEGRITLRVTGDGAARQDGGIPVRFEVEDTGIGFDPGKRDALFAPFAQADSSITRRYGGTGLGLAICAQLVRMLGGEIDVDGAPELGTRFWFTIPLRPAQGEAPIVIAPSARESLEGLRVLVVDDSAVSRAYLRSLLVAWHVECEAVASGGEALERLRIAADEEDRPFELVILDRLMPGMDGMELAGRIGDAPEFGAPKLVMVTRYGGSVAAEEAMRSGIVGYLNKPVSQSQLYDTLIKVAGLESGARADHEAARTGRILIVEDNLVNQKVAAGMLRKLGYEADAVTDGQQALSAVQRTRYDLVLMDCQMPVMDGYTATAELRAREAQGDHLPIVAMTAHALGGEREKCLAAGMDDYLAKPVRINDLKQKVDYWCRTRLAELAPTQAASPAGTASGAGERDALPEASPTDGSEVGEAVDRATLDALLEVMGEDLVELIDTFLDDTSERLAQLARAVETRDQELVTVAHTLKGSSANVGARRFSERCAAVHQRAKRDTSDPDLSALVGGLVDEFAKVRSELAAYRASI